MTDNSDHCHCVFDSTPAVPTGDHAEQFVALTVNESRAWELLALVVVKPDVACSTGQIRGEPAATLFAELAGVPLHFCWDGWANWLACLLHPRAVTARVPS